MIAVILFTVSIVVIYLAVSTDYKNTMKKIEHYNRKGREPLD